MSNLLRRILVAVVGIPIAFGFVYLGGWPLTALVAFIAVAGTAELYRMAAAGGVRVSGAVGFVGAALLPVVAFVVSPAGPGLGAEWVAFGGAAWIIVTLTLVMAAHRPTERPLAAVAVTLFGALYAGGLPAFLLMLRHGPGLGDRWAATWLVFLPLALTWVCDTAAMAGGKLIGGPKLAPVLSPNKTWAGGIAGTVSAVIVAPIYGALALAPGGVALGWWQLATFGLVVSVMGQVGDVAESLLKREVGLKDSGHFFPGHGGVLDRFDSLYWALPTAAALLTLYGVL